jgi:hypothetical protein
MGGGFKPAQSVWYDVLDRMAGPVMAEKKIECCRESVVEKEGDEKGEGGWTAFTYGRIFEEGGGKETKLPAVNRSRSIAHRWLGYRNSDIK